MPPKSGKAAKAQDKAKAATKQKVRQQCSLSELMGDFSAKADACTPCRQQRTRPSA